MSHSKIHVIFLQTMGKYKRGFSTFVSNGFFRNYLRPYEIATNYEKELEQQLNTKNVIEQKFLELEEKFLFFERHAAGNGVLYNGVNKQQIANYINEHLKEYCKEPLSFKKIIIDNPIKSCGLFIVFIQDIYDKIKVNVCVGRSIEHAQEFIPKEDKSNEN